MLGVDDNTLALAAAAMRGGHDQIVMIDGLAARAGEAAKLAPQALLFTEWEVLLGASGFEAILLAADEPALRVEQLRRLTQLQRGIAVLVSHPLSMSMLEYYELEMIRQETAAVVQPYLPARWHPAVAKLQSLIENGNDSPFGAVEQIVFQRNLSSRDRQNVLRQFARDADILQQLAGQATQLHAFASSGALARTTAIPVAPPQSSQESRNQTSPGDLRDLVVQLNCDRGLICRWNVSPKTDQAEATLTVVGLHGVANLHITDEGRPWRLEIQSTSDSTVYDYPNWNPAAAALAKLNEAHQSLVEMPPTLAEAARTVELVETIDRSLARGRTIDLHHEEFTDIGTFKGTMTSVGCGLLVAGLALVVLVALVHLVAVQAGWNQLAAQLDNWPYLLLAVCAIYLLLQPLVFIGKRRQKSETSSSNGERGAGMGRMDKL
jgi:myo-inositol 2-dehydrogenase/D-chiro-inositol 1-dehydrogenase